MSEILYSMHLLEYTNIIHPRLTVLEISNNSKTILVRNIKQTDVIIYVNTANIDPLLTKDVRSAKLGVFTSSHHRVRSLSEITSCAWTGCIHVS